MVADNITMPLDTEINVIIACKTTGVYSSIFVILLVELCY